MAGHPIIVIGASAGGIEALKRLVSQLPPDLPAAVFVTVHIALYSPSIIPEILARSGPLPAVHPAHGQPIEMGHIYVAPPDYQMLVERDTISVIHGPSENGHRPAIDPLFRSAARAYGPGVIGVVLTGALDDGTSGLYAIKLRKGLAVVQDPDDAQFRGMPSSAIAKVDVDYVSTLYDMGALLVRLVHEPAPELPPAAEHILDSDVRAAELDLEALQPEHLGEQPAGLVCPACGGSLFEIREGDSVRYRCRVGHGYGEESLAAKQNSAIEEAFWMALRALEEKMALTERMARHAQEHGHLHTAERYENQISETRFRAKTVREILASGILSDDAFTAGD